MNTPEFILALLATAGTAAGSVAAWHRQGRAARLAEQQIERDKIEADRRAAEDVIAKAAVAAAELRLREQEVKVDDRTSTAELINNLTLAYERHVHTLGEHTQSLERRVEKLEEIVNDRDGAIHERDNVIRRLRDQLHAANNELFKAGLRANIIEPSQLVGGLAPDRRAEPRVPPVDDPESGFGVLR